MTLTATSSPTAPEAYDWPAWELSDTPHITSRYALTANA